ncbi:PREDICTED: DNA-directed RNA polymerase II subunit RPB7 [Pterocles gutturalis]|uniref:DNA-directed RNA polymerase II subunit RPB7 n=1 Tax=Pterocles gutturalis TaxID=240206 RepID=UPI000528472F|nr:PREDICTED: DNA-directed RNA polymerase II subunit RPB7 [Pterocles gutturalis]
MQLDDTLCGKIVHKKEQRLLIEVEKICTGRYNTVTAVTAVNESSCQPVGLQICACRPEKEAGPSTGVGSMSCFISCHFILSEKKLDPNFNPSCYKTVLILITQWLRKTKIQLMATEAQTAKNDLPSPALSLLRMRCRDLSLSPPLPTRASLHHTCRNRGVCLNPENRRLNFYTPLSNETLREMQTQTESSQKRNALNTRISKWQYLCQRFTCDSHLTPCPEKQWRTRTSRHPLCHSHSSDCSGSSSQSRQPKSLVQVKNPIQSSH